MKFNFSELTEPERISFLQRFILIHSYLYYEMDTNIISDQKYDAAARQLTTMQQDFDLSATDYGYVFDEFTGVTGFDLFSKLNDKDKDLIKDLARRIERNYKDSQYGTKSNNKV